MRFFSRICFKLLISLCLLALLTAGAAKYFIFGIHTHIKADIGLKKTNAVWLAHEWIEVSQPKGKIHGMLSNLISNDMSLIFLHTGPIGSDGIIPPERYLEAKEFLKTAKTLAPDMKFHAWIGQMRDTLPIEDPFVRQNIIKDSIHLVQNIGFDGIHLNIEPMQSDPNFALLIWELDMAFEEAGISAEISAAVSPIVPEIPLKIFKFIYKEKFLGHDLNRAYSTLEYIEEMAKSLDYIVLMGYDTSFKDAAIYKWFIEQELIFLLKAAPGKAIIGIPSYEDLRDNFGPGIENVETAIEGIANGLRNIRVDSEDLAGIAVYADWTTDGTEWKTWREKWLGVGTDK